MDAFSFLRKYQELQRKVFFDKIIDLSFAKINYSEEEKTTFSNFALTNQLLNGEQLELVQQKMLLLDRKPAIYFENRENLKPLSEFLILKGYKKDYEDSWMFYLGAIIDKSDFNQVKKVENERELEIFLETFNNCYQKGDPQNPYGSVGDYLKVTRTNWYKHQKTDRLEYFIVYKKEEPVAVGTLNNYQGLGYISNIGSLKSVRGEGFGKLVTLYCVHISQVHGNKTHCLATEEGSYPNEFYKRIGFKTLFTGVCYTLK